MQKFYAYIGLVATIALAVFLLYPFGQTYRIDATPFDSDAISAIIQSTSEIPKFMNEARRCISYSYTANPIPTEGDCTASGTGPDILFIYTHSAQLSRYIPDIAERLDAIIDAHNPESPLITDDGWKDIVPLDPTAPVPEEQTVQRHVGPRPPPPTKLSDIAGNLHEIPDAGNPESLLITALQADVIVHYPKLFAQYKASYAILTYISHAAVFFILIAMIWKRRIVGHSIAASVTVPVTLILKALTVFHRRV